MKLRRSDQAHTRGVELALPIPGKLATHRTPRAWAISQRVIGTASCILLAPVFAIMYVAVRATSAGPFLFEQKRRGHRGVPMMVLKVRTMEVGAEVPTALGTSRRSPRITAVGRLLRELKLDELPQLWNVARGDMELVGPRPIPIALDDELRKNIPDFAMRYEVKPGLTNVSQVAVLDNKLGEKLVDDWKLRFEGELHYIKHKSFAYDVVVLAMTVLFVLRKLFPTLTGGPRPARAQAASEKRAQA